MRRRLVLVALAITSMVTLAFLGPLAYYVYTNAEQSAIIDGKIIAKNAAQYVSESSTVADLSSQLSVIQGVQLQSDDPPGKPLTVYMSDGLSIAGYPQVWTDNVKVARFNRTYVAKHVPGGVEILYPVVFAGSTKAPAIVRVFVSNDELRRNVYSLWFILGAVALALLLGGIAVADRLARSVVVPVRELADVTRRLSAGEGGARTTPAGPPEIADVGSAVNHLADRIDDLISAEREMIADLSHRLRTPLAALRLNADTIQDVEARDRITDDIDAMELAVNNVIREARAPRRVADISCDLVDVCRSRAEFWSVLAEDQGRAWSVALPSRTIDIPLRRNDLEAAMDAMLGNALHYTPEGTPVHVAAQVDNRRARLIVEDEGPGFPHGFVPERGSSGGTSTGLGLDIIKRTAQAAGGGLTIENRPRGGAHVEMWFPLRQRDGAKAARANARAAGRLHLRPGDRHSPRRELNGGNRDDSSTTPTTQPNTPPPDEAGGTARSA